MEYGEFLRVTIDATNVSDYNFTKDTCVPTKFEYRKVESGKVHEGEIYGSYPVSRTNEMLYLLKKGHKPSEVEKRTEASKKEIWWGHLFDDIEQGLIKIKELGENTKLTELCEKAINDIVVIREVAEVYSKRFNESDSGRWVGYERGRIAGIIDMLEKLKDIST